MRRQDCFQGGSGGRRGNAQFALCESKIFWSFGAAYSQHLSNVHKIDGEEQDRYLAGGSTGLKPVLKKK